MKFLSIDRLDGAYAICQDDEEKMYEIKIGKLPPNIKPGDVLILSSDGLLNLDINETAKRKKRIKELQDKLFDVD